MNGPMKMYSIKPIVRHDLPPMDTSDCMYRIRSLHSPSRNGTVIRDTGHVTTASENLGTFDQVIQFLKNIEEPPEMTALVVRQEHILNQLAELKKQMLTLKEALHFSSPSITSTSTSERKPLKIENVPDLVINASPKYPPYYLQALQSVWKDVRLKVQCHLHSSMVSNIDESARLLVDRLQSFRPKLKPQIEINVRIIWKEVGSQTELMVSKVPILGEVNILRYLARVTSTLNYETTNPLELDGILDTCYLLVRSSTKTERTGLLQSLNKKLGKASWLCDRNELTIADVAMYSALKQISTKEINVNMSKWLQKCEADFY